MSEASKRPSLGPPGSRPSQRAPKRLVTFVVAHKRFSVKEIPIAFLPKIDRGLIRPIYKLTLPVFLGSQLDNLVGLADIYMVGHLGVDAMSAVGIARTLTMVVTVAMVAVTTGAFTLVAQAIGAGDPKEASSAAKQALTLVGFVGLGLSVIGLAIASPALYFLSPSAEVARLGIPYLMVFFGGLVFMNLNYAVQNCLHGAGDTRTPLYINLLISAVKLLASYGLIYGEWGLPALGIAGAAIGSVIGRIVGLVVGLWALHSGRFALAFLPGTSYRPERELTRRIFKIGIPAALQGFFRNGSNLVFVKFLALTHSPIAAVAAFTVGGQIERILRRGSLSFGTAAQTLVGQHIGSGDLDRADRYGWTTMLIGPLSMLLLGLPIALLGTHYMGLFTQDAAVVQIGVAYLWAVVLAEPFMALSIISGGGLRGAGDSRPPLNHTLVAQWLVRLPVSYVLAFVLGLDIYGLWIGLVVFSGVQGLLTSRRFAGGVWKTMRV